MHAGKHQNFYKLALSFLIELARHAQSMQDRKLVEFFKYIKKKSIATAFVFHSDVKHSDTGFQSCSLLLVFGRLWSEMDVAF